MIDDSPMLFVDLIADFFDGLEITFREVIFSILIIGILLAIGFYGASVVEKDVLDKQLVYRQAAQISDTNEFAHAMRTDVGMALVEGDFHAIKPVVMNKCKGSWLKIVADYQKYTMHTRVVTYTTGSGKNVQTHTRVETYWTWDTYNVKRACCRDVQFCGSTFATDEFDYGDVRSSHQTVDNGYHHRIVFSCLPKDFHATIASRLFDNSIHDKPLLHYESDLAQTYEYYTTSHAVCIFWICWVVLMILILMVFYRFENEWLED